MGDDNGRTSEVFVQSLQYNVDGNSRTGAFKER